MAEFVVLATSVIALVERAITLVNGLKRSIEEWESRNKKVKELVKTLDTARVILDSLKRSQKDLDQPDDDLKPHLLGLIEGINKIQTIQHQIRIEERELQSGKLRTLVEKLKVLGGQGIANRNRKVVALTGSLRRGLDDITHILVMKLYVKVNVTLALETSEEYRLLLFILKRLANDTRADEVVEAKCRIKKLGDKKFHIPEEEEEQNRRIEEIEVEESEEDFPIPEEEEEQEEEMEEESEEEDFSADDEDGMRGATLGGIEVPNYTKVEFEMSVSGEMYFHLVTYTEGPEARPDLLFPTGKSEDHKITSGRTFPQRFNHKEDPYFVKLKKPEDVELESTTLYLVFSPTPLVNAGGNGDYSVSLNQLLEAYESVKVKDFKFDIVN
ncbi:hypothetical protein R1flu_007679 [Riccia fluitans]|uniref:Uncharacterized protein n=1 Tax=Riccia fluitans TaxID=41844 RepID=A0ABD1YZI9_9MARC